MPSAAIFRVRYRGAGRWRVGGHRVTKRIYPHWRALGLRGAVCAWRARRSGKERLLSVRPRGCRHPFALRIPSSDLRTFEQIFRQREYAFETDRAPGVIVDAGANIGLAAIYLANRYPEARIIALEPEAENFALLSANVAPYPQITPVQAALWHRNGEVAVADHGWGAWAFVTVERDGPAPGDAVLRHGVAAVTVDGLMDTYKLDRIDLLKVDIEGAEMEVFGDTAAWIDRVDAVAIELHEALRPGCSAVFGAGCSGLATAWEQGEKVCRVRGDWLRMGGAGR